MLAPTGAISSLVWRRGWRSHRQPTVSHDGGSSSRPYTVVSMPAMWYVLDDIAAGVGCKVSRGFGADMMPGAWLGGNN
jgi:hypothetical protein